MHRLEYTHIISLFVHMYLSRRTFNSQESRWFQSVMVGFLRFGSFTDLIDGNVKVLNVNVPSYIISLRTKDFNLVGFHDASKTKGRISETNFYFLVFRSVEYYLWASMCLITYLGNRHG